jgi:crossover junction endodeoxyribonuclease RusA
MTLGTENALSSPLVLALPWPPSVNHEWTVAHGRAILAQAGRQYRARVNAYVMGQRHEGRIPLEPLDGLLAVRLDLWPPDRRRRDADNYAKAVLDALTHAGVWRDDCQIRDLRSVMHSPVKGGAVRLTAAPFEEDEDAGD